MIDHLFNYPDETSAIGALPEYYIPPEGSEADNTYTPGAWRGDVCIPNVLVYQVTGTEDVTDPETGETYPVEVREYAPGWFVWVTQDVLLDNPGLVVAVDYDTWAGSDDPTVKGAGAVLAGELPEGVHIEPVFGREKPYPFG